MDKCEPQLLLCKLTYSLCFPTFYSLITVLFLREKGGGDRLTWTDLLESTRPVQPTMYTTPGTVTCRCGNVCKNQRGLRIHQAMSGCQRVRSRGQRIASMASETQYWGTLRPGKKHRMPVRSEWRPPPIATPNPERERAVQKQSNWHVQIDHVNPLTMNPETKD